MANYDVDRSAVMTELEPYYWGDKMELYVGWTYDGSTNITFPEDRSSEYVYLGGMLCNGMYDLYCSSPFC